MACFSGGQDQLFSRSDYCVEVRQTTAKPVIEWDQRDDSITYTLTLTPINPPPGIPSQSGVKSVTLVNSSDCGLPALSSPCVAQSVFCFSEVAISGLTPGTRYFPSAVCSDGITISSPENVQIIVTFPAQTCTTGVASPGSTTATLTGSTVVGVVEGSVPDYFLVNRPDENRVRCKFEYGPTILYGSETPPVGPFKSTTVSQSHGVWANIDGLEPNTVYHYRLVAYTDEVTVNGADMVFKTSDQPAIVGVL